jgi:hypothetical protein
MRGCYNCDGIWGGKIFNRLNGRLWSTPLQEIIAGGVAGATAKTCVAPLERCKILFQVGCSVDTLCNSVCLFVCIAAWP